MKKLIGYCRGCNREIEIYEIKGESYIELIGSTKYAHPKQDVDIRDKSNESDEN